MEFKIKNINTNCNVIIKIFSVGKDVAFTLTHNCITYNSLFDDVLYVFGSVTRTIPVGTLITFANTEECINSKGIRLPVHINMYLSQDVYELYRGTRGIEYRLSAGIYIREPEDPNQKMIIEKEIIKEVFVDREVIQDKIVHVAAVKEINELEDCAICRDDKGYISSGCCSLRQCLKCSMKMCDKGSCPQCRRPIQSDNLIHTLFPCQSR
jgi:hypothetical protein